MPVEVAHPGADRTIANVPDSHTVLLNALFLDPSVSGGPETYLRALAPALLEVRPTAKLTVATTRRGAAALRGAGWPDIGIAIQELPCDEGERIRRQLSEQVMLPRLGRQLGADVLHSLASVAPIRVRGLAHVITLHDVNFIHHSTFNPVTSWGMRQVIPRAARHADALIADTAVSRDDVCATLGLSADSFSVVPLGVELRNGARPPAETEMRARFGLGDGRIVLCVGAKRPHKNQAVLIRALPELPSDVRLVLAGHAEPYDASLRELARQLGLDDQVVFADWVPEEDLEGLWSIAAVAAFPTLAEGFGLPILEATARGVPVAASDLPVIREVANGWPSYFDPSDASDVARAIRAGLAEARDPATGRALASRFTWTATAEATWDVYDRAVVRHRRVGQGS
jgi:glycosyltransferase involved in cell wall biosynthesis